MLICKDDYKEAADSICKLCNNSELVKKLTCNSYVEILNFFDIKTVVKKYENLFFDTYEIIFLNLLWIYNFIIRYILSKTIVVINLITDVLKIYYLKFKLNWTIKWVQII